MRHPLLRPPGLGSIATVCAALAAVASLAVPAQAQVSIAPGQSVNLGGSDSGGGPADGGEVACRISFSGVPCVVGFLGTSAAPGENTVDAHHNSVIVQGLGEPRVATARIYDDFQIPGDPDSYVNVQFSVTYDLILSLVGSAAYESAGELSLVVEDITSNPAEGVGAVSLFRQDRSGDQGFTDVTTGREAYRIEAAHGNLELLLRRGHRYRVWFEAEVMGEQFLVGLAEVNSWAERRALVVHVDEDEVDLLAIHDRDVKEQLDRIEGKISAVNQKLDLLLKTQLEQTLAVGSQSRLTVLHTERKQEVCDAAQQAINTSAGLGYKVKQKLQLTVDKGLSLLASDPKLAVVLCQNAYTGASFPIKRK